MQRRKVRLIAAVLILCVVLGVLLLLSFPAKKPAVKEKNVGMAVVVDAEGQKAYNQQIATLRCYARRRGYQFFILLASAFPECDVFTGILFKKPCVVHHALSRMRVGYSLFVFDADTVAVSFNAPLERWLDTRDDLVFYDREWNGEVTAGIYCVRNTPIARHFLAKWAAFGFRQPVGFSSADNGALHLLLLEVLRLKNQHFCNRLYYNLKASVDDLIPYYSFVACTRRALGPSRRWKVVVLGVGSGQITILNRFHGWAVDWNRLRVSSVIPFAHGVKNASAIDSLNFDFAKCVIKKKPSSLRVAGAAAHRSEKAVAQLKLPFGLVPRWPIAHCLGNFSCHPLEDDEEDEKHSTSLSFGLNNRTEDFWLRRFI